MNITKQQNEAMTSQPLPFVASYAGQKEIITVNLGIEKKEENARTSEATPMAENADIDNYQCTTLSISHEGRMTANELISELVKAGVFGMIGKDFLQLFSQHYGITDYDSLTAVLISGKYSYPEELSCHRKALLGNMEPLKALNDYVEQCKTLAAQCFAKDGE